MKTRKYTRAVFASIDDTVRRLRRTDPLQFAVLYNDWLRFHKQF